MVNVFWIAVGGAIGATLRYGCTGAVHRLLGENFYWGTLFVNLIGCLVIGLLWAVAERAPERRVAAAFLFTGVVGAFTTFSTYGLEAFQLFRDGRLAAGISYIMLSNVLGLALVAVGFVLGQLLLTQMGAGRGA